MTDEFKKLENKARMIKTMISIKKQLDNHDGTVTIVGSDVLDLNEIVTDWLDKRDQELK